jgi:hypothetical protein
MIGDGSNVVAAAAEGGLVLVNGPGIVVSLTPMEAVALAQSLWSAAGWATMQVVGREMDI